MSSLVFDSCNACLTIRFLLLPQVRALRAIQSENPVSHLPPFLASLPWFKIEVAHMLVALSEDPRGLPATRFASSAANRSNSSESVVENPNLDIAAAAFVNDPPGY